jgi:hypothetical protein
MTVLLESNVPSIPYGQASYSVMNITHARLQSKQLLCSMTDTTHYHTRRIVASEISQRISSPAISHE